MHCCVDFRGGLSWGNLGVCGVMNLGGVIIASRSRGVPIHPGQLQVQISFSNFLKTGGVWDRTSEQLSIMKVSAEWRRIEFEIFLHGPLPHRQMNHNPPHDDG
jgi:hypothetical protein